MLLLILFGWSAASAPDRTEDFLLSRQQRLTTWMAAVTVMIGSLGVPLSSQRAVRTGEAFPCQDCVCGCSDAETCWRDCCCFSNAQKVVWAEKNGVKVPIFVVAAARREQSAHAAKPACCNGQSAGGECEQQACTETDEPCDSPSCCEKKSHASSEESGGKIILLMTALKCRGISVSIGLLPPSVPPADLAVVALVVDLGALPAEADVNYLSPCHDVATPPPDACELYAV